MLMSWRILISLVMIFFLSACESQSKTSTATNDHPTAQPSTFTGTLQNGVMGIGGEHTGWILVGDGEAGGVEVHVSMAERFTGTSGERDQHLPRRAGGD